MNKKLEAAASASSAASAANVKSKGKTLTNKIKNKYRNISKKENRSFNRLKNSKKLAESTTQAAAAVLDSSSSQTTSNIIINQINLNISSIKKSNSLNLSLIKESSVSPQHDVNHSKDKKLTNSTNLSLRNASRPQKQHLPQVKSILAKAALSSPLKRLNGQNGDYLKLKTNEITVELNEQNGIARKRRKFTDISSSNDNNTLSNDSNKATIASATASPVESQLDLNKSRTRFSQRINNSHK